MIQVFMPEALFGVIEGMTKVHTRAHILRMEDTINKNIVTMIKTKLYSAVMFVPFFCVCDY